MLVWLAGGIVRADESAPPSAEEEALKVAFIYNFAKFTQWPGVDAAARTASVVICVFGRIPFQRQLASVDGKAVGEQRVVVKYLTDIAQVGQCHILYVGDLEPEVRKAAIGAARAFPVLTISDTPDFARQGGIVEVARQEQRLRLRINNNNAEAVGLRLSSKVLKLAIIVP